MPHHSPHRLGGALKKFVIGLGVLVVVLVAAVALLTPIIASNLLTRTIPLDLPSGKGSLALSDVAISWGGPQRIGKVTLDDAQGARMADLNVAVRTSLVGLITSGGNIGTITASGSLNIKEEQLASSTTTKPTAPQTAPKGSSSSSAPLEIPSGLRATLDVKPVNITYTPRAGSGLSPLNITDFAAFITVSGAGDATLNLSAASPTIDVKGAARKFVTTSGRLDLASAEGELNATISAPGELVEALTRLALKAPAGGASQSSAAAPTEVAASLTVSGGRLRLTDSTRPITIKGPVPQALLAMLAGADAAFSIEGSPSITKTIDALDLALPSASGAMDLRGSSIRATLSTTPIEGAIRSGSSGAFRVEPATFVLDAPDLAKDITLKGAARGSFDGRDAGSIEIDALVAGILDEKGTPRAGLPAGLRADVKLVDVPTVLGDPLIRAQGLSLPELVGPAMNAALSVRTLESASGSLPPTRIQANITADHLNAKLDAQVNQDAITLKGEALSISATRIAPLLRALIKDQPQFVFSGDGRATLTARDLTAPMLSGSMPDLTRLTGDIAMTISDLTLEQGAGDRPLALQSLTTTLAVTGLSAPKITMKHVLSSGGKPFNTDGDFTLDGLLAKSDGPWPYVSVTPASLKPAGTLTIVGLPSDLLGFMPADLRAGARQSLGETLNLEAKGSRDPGGSADLDLTITSEGLNARAGFLVDATTLRTKDQGITATLLRPAPLVQSAMQSQPESVVAGVNWGEALTLDVPTLSMKLPQGGAPLALNSIDLEARLRSAGIDIDLRPSPGSRAERIEARTLDASIRNTPTEGASLSLDSEGSYAGEAFLLKGDMAFGKILGEQSIDLAALTPKGAIEALSIPSALAAVFDAKNGPIIREATGQRFDLSLRAPASGDASTTAVGPRSIALNLKSANLNAASSVALEGKTVNVGQSDVALTLTPALVDAALAAHAPDLKPAPALAQPARFNLVVFPTGVELDEKNAPNLDSLRVVRAMLTSPDDVVVMDIPAGEKPINAGLRGIEAGLAWLHRDIRKREGSLKAQLFEPSTPAKVLAVLEATSDLASPPATFSARINQIDAAGVDALLGQPGLLAGLVGPAAAVGLDGSSQKGVQTILAQVTSERLNTSMNLRRTETRIDLAEPARVALTLPATWANRYLMSERPGQPAAALRFADDAPITMNLLALSLASGETPLRPGVFNLSADATAPQLRFTTAEGKNVEVQSLNAAVRSEAASKGIAFDISSSRVGLAGGPAAPLTIKGNAANITDDSGKPTPDALALTAQASGTLPTALVDALANQKGLLIDLLGATTKVELTAANLSKQAGSMSGKIDASNINAAIAGDVRDASFIAQGPATIAINRITPEFSKRYLESVIPIVSKFEKTTDDEPATIRAQGLTLPTDSDTRKINGVIDVDLGTLQFTTSDFFGRLVKFAGGKEKGRVGQRVKPFQFVAQQGVVSYEKIELPLGEFDIETRGQVDLNTQRMDVVTFVPFYAVAEELAGAVRNVPGIDRLTRIPIRTHGPLDNPKSEVKLDLLVQDSVPGIIEDVLPEDIKKALPPGIGEGLKDLFKKKDDKKKK